jgi:lipoic acid synthetase
VDAIEERGGHVVHSDRGGDITFHGPGQLVAYPILDLRGRGLGPATYVRMLERTILETLARFGVHARQVEGRPGVWVGDEKIAALGVRVREGVSTHGIAINVTTDLDWFDAIVPCGLADAGVTSIARVRGTAPAPGSMRRRARWPGGERFMEVKRLLRERSLHTVCEEAHCPNIGECFNAGTATFMILGDVCTRACGFCDVTSGRPVGLDLLEPVRLASTVETLGLDYAVITSVNRDDLADGGASIFAACIRAVRHRTPACEVEVLIPDFEGNWDALRTVVEARPVVFNHNTETVPRLYPRVRPKGVYTRSLELIQRVKQIDPAMTTKSGIMVGLGETFEEVLETMRDLRAHHCDLLTVGQYLRPSAKHLPVERYWHPDEFAALAEAGRDLGFAHVEAGPLVRSSYHAGEQRIAASGRPV